MQARAHERRFAVALLALSFVLAACDSAGGEAVSDTVDAAVAVDVMEGDVPAVADISAAEDVPAGADLGGPDTAVDAAGETASDVVADAGEPAYKMLPVAACGMPSYELIDPAELGEVLAWEPIPLWDVPAATLNALLASTDFGAFQVPYGATVYRMRYTTQDRGQLVEATAVVAVPKGEDVPAGPLPIILHEHGTTGFVDECAPSHPNNAGALSAVPALMAAMGYVFVGPDYIGMNGFGEPATVRHAYMVAEQAAIGSWDAVRAARRALVSELEPVVETTRQVVPWGESQGGHAALFAEQYAPYYAPEFDVPAVVQLVGPPNLLPVLQYATAELASGSGIAMVSLAAMHEWYGQLAPLDTILTNEPPTFLADSVLAAIYPEDRCDIEGVPRVDTVAQIFNLPALMNIATGNWDALAPWSCYYKENSLPTSSVTPQRYVPTLMVYGENDDLMYPETGRESFVELCDLGWQLDYLECSGASHTDAAILSLTEQFEWVAARLAGEPIDDTELCELQAPRTCTLGR